MSDRGRPDDPPPPAPLPVNVELEQAVLGAVLVNNEAWHRVASFLLADHFAEPLHAKIFEVMAQMIAAHLSITPATIRTYLPADLPGVAGGQPFSVPHYIASLAANAVPIVVAQDHGRILFELAQRRTMIALGEAMSYNARRGDLFFDTGGLVAEAQSALFEVATGLSDLGALGQAVESFDDVVAAAEARMKEGASSIRGVPSGLASLDHKLGGFVPTDLVLLAGRPSMGKTHVGIGIGRGTARRGHGVGFLSLEMSTAQLRARLLSAELEAMGHRLPYNVIDRRLIRPDDLPVLREAAARLAAYPFTIIDRGNRLADIPGHIRTARRNLARWGKELALFIIDYLGLVDAGERYRGNKVQEVGQISATLKTIAKTEGIPILALHQLNRATEGRKDKRPLLSDLRESGSLEQDADAVVFVYREGYYVERPGYIDFATEHDRLAEVGRVEHDMELIISKARHGPTGTVEIWCDMPTNAIADKHLAT